ncbi:MAG: hypothetical protein V4736_07690 [Bdellovibrionota bacterium]
MKAILLSLLLIPAFLIAAEKVDRQPASLENELVQARIKTAEILTRARQANKTCEIGSYQSEILRELEGVKSLPGFSPSLVPANIREELKSIISFKEMMGEVNLDNSPSVQELTKALTNAYFEAQGMGVYGPPEWFTLRPNGVVEFSRRIVLNEAPWTKVENSTGTWGVQTKKVGYENITRVWYKVNGKTSTYQLTKNWETVGNWILHNTPRKLNLGTSSLRIKFFNLINSECEA